MEICGLLVAAGKDGKEYILKASDSSFPLIGDTQEEDRRQIADLVVGRMQVWKNTKSFSKPKKIFTSRHEFGRVDTDLFIIYLISSA